MASYCLLWIPLSFQYGVYSENKEFAPAGANSLLYELTPKEKEGIKKNENGRVVVLLFYVHGKHLRSCRDSQLT